MRRGRLEQKVLLFGVLRVVLFLMNCFGQFGLGEDILDGCIDYVVAMDVFAVVFGH